ncbi:MAG: diguanylate cyclase [Kiritimatiellae bacterium]|jgi:diguanylate cyclase (GGDEF)-like protein|nr:diguanylate cyclase [Kiritimatiellia bacterium]
MTSSHKPNTKTENQPEVDRQDLLPLEFQLVQRMLDASFPQHDQLEMLKICARGLLEHFQGQAVVLWVRESDRQWLLVIASPCPLMPQAVEQLEMDARAAYQNLSEQDVTVSTRSVYMDVQNSESEPVSPLCTWTSYPIRVGQENLGVLLVDRSSDSDLPPDCLARLEFVLHHLGTSLLAIQHVRELLITDPLTGCFNRWFMDVELSLRCEADPHQKAKSFAVLLLDVDHFKSINDSYGHGAGDSCLIELVQLVRQTIHDTDELIRMGGDEFLLFLPRGQHRDLPGLAQEILTTVRSNLKLAEAPDREITLSMGLVVHDEGEDPVSKEEMLDRVDKALYASKRAGRNQVTLWSPDLKSGGESECASLRGNTNECRKLERKVQELEARLSRQEAQVVETFNLILSTKEFETGLHSLRVTRITGFLLDKLDMSEAEKLHIRRGAQLHDIGKLAIPEAILHKQGRLTESEWMVMRQHPLIGHRFVAGYPFLEKAAEIILHHHEAYDGTGYPHGLKGEEIPLGARLFTLVDAYDTMRANRIYKPFVPRADVIEELKSKAGTQFDPHLVKLFLEHCDEIETMGSWQ